MSLSPTSEGPGAMSQKRRRDSDAGSVDDYGAHAGMMMLQEAGLGGVGSSGGGPLPGHIPKRGARACTACRKGKNRCEGEAPCRRCQLSGIPCVFEKPEKNKNVVALANGSMERVSRLEGQYLVMQSQMIGMQNSLDRIINMLQAGPAQQPPAQASFVTNMPPPAPPTSGYPGDHTQQNGGARAFPPLPGFAPPPHKYATYGIVPSTAPSSDDESEDTLPRATLNAPIEALQGLANAAVEAASTSSTSRVKKRKRVEPIPRNAFPHVVEKGLVSDEEARELYHIFFSGCHLFIPLFDPAYDTYEGLKERTPFCFDAILAVASKIRAGNGMPTPTFYKCLDEAQGIARSTLFGPIVRKEAVQAMIVLAAWSQSGWLPSGHAMRMALDLGLHRALEKLVDGSAAAGKHRTDDEERELVVSARIWLCLYWLDHQMSLGTGRPIVLRDEGSIRNCRVLLTHPMSTATDVRLVSQIELIAQKTQIYETLNNTPNGQVTHNMLAFIRRANLALDKWWSDCDELHRATMDDDALLRKMLIAELYYSKLWLVCVALRGVSWDKMPFEQRELVFSAKEAATNCLATCLGASAYRPALRYAVHDSWVTAAFSGMFLLKMANLFPAEVDVAGIATQVDQLAQLLSDVAAERYALTLRLMLARFRHKLGIDVFAQEAPVDDLSLQAFAWPGGANTLPLWLQETSLTDLGLPINGSDGIFLQMHHNPGTWTNEIPNMPEAW